MSLWVVLLVLCWWIIDSGCFPTKSGRFPCLLPGEDLCKTAICVQVEACVCGQWDLNRVGYFFFFLMASFQKWFSTGCPQRTFDNVDSFGCHNLEGKDQGGTADVLY